MWTCQKHGRPLPKLDTTFVSAQPSLTHMVRMLTTALLDFDHHDLFHPGNGRQLQLRTDALAVRCVLLQ